MSDKRVMLLAASTTAPAGLEAMLRELGRGEGGFGGTGVGRGEQTLLEFLEHCVAQQQAPGVIQGRVPQTTFWIMAGDRVAGMLRMRHYLNDALRISGGHIGYYVSPGARRRGIATRALGLALEALASRGERRIMLTTDPGNVASIRVIERHGGRLAAQVPDPDGGLLNQYWIEIRTPSG